jgi:lipopolysaccharide assembly protein A
MRILVLFALVIIFVLALVFSVQNFHSVEIFLYFTSISLPLAVALTIELLVGIAIGAAVVYFQLAKLKSKYAELNKKLSRLENLSK